LFDNPFSFNLADIYIFLGLVLYLLAPRETHDPADGPIHPGAFMFLAKTLGNFGLTLALLISCLYMSWQILSQANFLYDQIYDHNDLEDHINEYAALNRNGKESFALTSKAERVQIFNDIAREVNTGGEGLATISFVGTGEATRTPFLIAEERDHLRDVANLVTSLKPLGALLASALIAFYGFCWYYKVSRYQYYWRPSGILVSLFQIATLAVVCVAITFALGPQKTFYLLHEWAFSDKAQWYFYFEDSLMTTLMPEVVFGNIAALIAVLTVFNWLLMNFILRRLLD
jgi:small-conductance mechanosensitive channel